MLAEFLMSCDVKDLNFTFAIWYWPPKVMLLFLFCFSLFLSLQTSLLQLLGFRIDGILEAALLPLGLTMTLFLGSLSMQGFAGLWRLYAGKLWDYNSLMSSKCWECPVLMDPGFYFFRTNVLDLESNWFTILKESCCCSCCRRVCIPGLYDASALAMFSPYDCYFYSTSFLRCWYVIIIWMVSNYPFVLANFLLNFVILNGIYLCSWIISELFKIC